MPFFNLSISGLHFSLRTFRQKHYLRNAQFAKNTFCVNFIFSNHTNARDVYTKIPVAPWGYEVRWDYYKYVEWHGIKNIFIPQKHVTMTNSATRKKAAPYTIKLLMEENTRGYSLSTEVLLKISVKIRIFSCLKLRLKIFLYILYYRYAKK